jgi:hypothetical protein
MCTYGLKPRLGGVSILDYCPLGSFRLGIQPLDGISNSAVYQDRRVSKLLGGISTPIGGTHLLFRSTRNDLGVLTPGMHLLPLKTDSASTNQSSRRNYASGPNHYLLGLAHLFGVFVLFGFWIWWGLGWISGRRDGWWYFCGSLLLFVLCLFLISHAASLLLNIEIVPQKHLTGNTYWGTVIDMANVLNTDKQIAVISALAL